MTDVITQTFVPGPRLIDGSDLNKLVGQMNAAFATLGAYASVTALDTVGAGTITAAGIIGGVTARGGAQSGAAFTDTTDTAAAIISALGGNIAVGASWFWFYRNTTNAQATLAAGSGVTLSGNTIVPKLTWAGYLVTKTSASAVSVAYVNGGYQLTLPPNYITSLQNSAITTLQVAGLTSAQLATIGFGGGSQKTITLPTAAEIIANYPNAAVGASNQVMIVNNSTVTLTFSGLAGTTVAGLALVQPSRTALAVQEIVSLGSVNLTGIASSQVAT